MAQLRHKQIGIDACELANDAKHYSNTTLNYICINIFLYNKNVKKIKETQKHLTSMP